MSHHGDKSFEEEMKEAARALGLGATGKHPDGKIAEHDEGELQLELTARKGVVVLNFGKQVAYLGLGPDEALGMASALIEKAREAAAQRVDILTAQVDAATGSRR